MSQRLGEILLAHGSIDTFQLQDALTHQRLQGRPLGASLVALRMCSNDQVLAALAAQAGLPAIDVDRETPDASLVRFLSRAAAEHFRALPLHHDERTGVMSIAVGAPATPDHLEDLRAATGAKALRAFLATDEAIARGIARMYSSKASAPAVLVYGWPEEDAGTLVQGLAARGISGRVAHSADVLLAGPREIVLAPVSAMEALLGGGRCRSLLIAAAKRAEDFPRAEKLDACSFLLAPLDMDCVMRAIQRCHQLLGVSSQRAA
ncbi:MAG TPA: hypothetical protein VFA20_12845 [Myxococcaceae bacterium]|nr:hypothetical protein [Myxococcaceae bacterium]